MHDTIIKKYIYIVIVNHNIIDVPRITVPNNITVQFASLSKCISISLHCALTLNITTIKLPSLIQIRSVNTPTLTSDLPGSCLVWCV